MVVENLTDMSLPPPEAAKYAIACGARVSGGTDMKRLSQCLAEDFGLTVRTTDDVNELLAHLRAPASESEPPAGAGVRAGGFTPPSEYGMKEGPAELERSEFRGGGIAVANVGGDRAGYKGVFSDGGHYVVVLGIAPDGRLLIADPGLYSGKYQKPHRKAAEVVDDLVYAQPDVLDKDAQNRSPRFTLLAV